MNFTYQPVKRIVRDEEESRTHTPVVQNFRQIYYPVIAYVESAILERVSRSIKLEVDIPMERWIMEDGPLLLEWQILRIEKRNEQRKKLGMPPVYTL